MARKIKTPPPAAALDEPMLPKDPNPLDERLYGYRLLNCQQVTNLTGMSRRQRMKLERGGTFPQPIRITQKIRLYPSRSVLAWIEKQEKLAGVA